MTRRRAATLHFNAIQLVGGLLPASLIEQIARQAAPKMSPQDYGLPKGMRLQVPLDQAWIQAKGLWEEAKELRSRGVDSAVGVHFSQRLLKEVFGWGDLQACDPRQIGEASFPINYRAFGGTVPLVLTSLPSEELDKGYKQFGQDNRRRSPHSCLQECLNADDAANWGVLCNGTTIRLLHDNPALVKPAYVAIALDQLFDGGLFDEFTVLWLLLQASRFQRDGEGECVLDGWKAKGQQTGERALNKLRDGVQLALENLANGMLQHRANQALIAQLESNELSTQAFFQELLRLVYRLLFLCVAEDRGLLFAEGSDPEKQAIYRQGYSLSRLRDLAIQRSAYERQYSDLWKVHRLVFAELDRGDSPLGLPGLGGLFAREKCVHLDRLEIPNGFLLEAVKAIGWFFDEQSQSRTRINYRDLNTEEFGSVYESLLELHPLINRSGGIWRLVLGGGAGSDRKTTGSYYTPDGLVQELIKSALLPVIRERLKNATTAEEKEAALLAIRVLDPACGSGHFLLAAARRLALELARIRAGDDQPSEELRQQCMREVVAKCIYGVDRNPMAVELCKVALWMEAIEPGKPLGFLDAHIQCGDSLVGVFDPKVLDGGIPDGAYKPLTGDEKDVCTSLKKDNQAFAKRGQGDLFSGIQAAIVTPSQEDFEAIEEENLAGLRAKQQAYVEWLEEPAVQRQRLAANTYTAAFFLKKDGTTRTHVPTSEHLDVLLRGGAMPIVMEANVQKAAADFRFLHWHLAFPNAMAAGGFDCVLGNPPWEMMQLDPREFFATRVPEIAAAQNMTARNHLIAELERNRPEIFKEFLVERLGVDGSQAFVHGSNRFPFTSFGRINLAPLFAELALVLISADSRAGMILPTGIVTDSFTQYFCRHILENHRVLSLYDFENRERLFPTVDSRMKFALISLGDGVLATDFVFFATATNQLADHRRHFALSADDIALINPNTCTCPVFRSQTDAELTKQIYQRVPVLIDEALGDRGNPWGIKFNLMFMMNTDSHLFFDVPTLDRLPLYEGKLIHHYDHRWATYDADGSSRDVTLAEKQVPEFQVQPRYWVSRQEVHDRLKAQGWDRQWLMGWRDICRSTDERTVIASVAPLGGAGNKWPLMIPSASHRGIMASLLIGSLSSLSYDFCARQKIGGTTMNFFIYKQLPVLPPSAYTQAAIDFIQPRVLELTYTAHDLKPWAEDLGYDGPPFRFDPERRALLRAELDAFYAHLYGLTRDELRYILDPADVMGPDYPSETFRVLKNNEIIQFGEYRTQRLVLEAWDRLFGGG